MLYSTLAAEREVELRSSRWVKEMSNLAFYFLGLPPIRQALLQSINRVAIGMSDMRC